MASSILLVSSEQSKWNDFTDALARKLPVEIIGVQAGAQALKAAREQKLLAAIIDNTLDDMTGVTLVQRLMEIDAMIHVALVSDKSADDFHTETEGLGIMLQLPPQPQPVQADDFAGLLREMDGTP